MSKEKLEKIIKDYEQTEDYSNTLFCGEVLDNELMERAYDQEPDNEKAQAIFKEKYFSNDTVDMINKMFQLLGNKNEKPYLFYEGEKYYFGGEYEFSDRDTNGFEIASLVGFNDSNGFKFRAERGGAYLGYNCISKIDHTAKYKKLFLELKEQAEKDGVNLKELI